MLNNLLNVTEKNNISVGQWGTITNMREVMKMLHKTPHRTQRDHQYGGNEYGASFNWLSGFVEKSISTVLEGILINQRFFNMHF